MKEKSSTVIIKLFSVKGHTYIAITGISLDDWFIFSTEAEITFLCYCESTNPVTEAFK